MSIIYKKIYNRAMPLFSIEYWYNAERIELQKLTKNIFYFEPLFIYNKGKGVSVYYDFFDPKQDPILLSKYYNSKKEEFFKLETEYTSIVNDMLTLAKDANPDNFEKLNKLIINFFPYLSLYIMLSGEIAYKIDQDIADKALEIRHATDRVLYEATDGMIEMAKKRLPEGYVKYLFWMTFNEISSGDLATIDELEKRKDGYIYFQGNLLTTDKVEAFALDNDLILSANETPNLDVEEIKGSSASSGRVNGIVRVIMEVNQFDNLKEGDILVTAMTTPDFLPIMKKASAFITDEGGITCHAAIIAREMKKPCVIGTKVATQVLKDGMKVEVDADNGIIRIIK